MATVFKPKRSEVALSIPAAGSLAVGELAMNITDGKFYTKTTGGTVKEVGGAGAVTLQNVTTSGAITDQDITLNGANLIFEGYLANAYETTLTVAEGSVDLFNDLGMVTAGAMTSAKVKKDEVPPQPTKITPEQLPTWQKTTDPDWAFKLKPDKQLVRIFYIYKS